MTAYTSAWDARLYDDRHAYVTHFGQDLLELLAPRPGERILDLGCGTGHLTAQIAGAGVLVIGLDKSPDMIAKARADYPHLEFHVGDGAAFQFDTLFDAIFSNAALHWMRDADAVAACMARALRPGGRLVAEFGGRGNVAAIVTAIFDTLAAMSVPLPAQPRWYFPGLGEYASLLERHGLEVIYAVLFDRPTPLEGEDGLHNWLTMFAGSLLLALPEAAREPLLAAVEDRTRPALYTDGRWLADYRRLRLVARRSD